MNIRVAPINQPKANADCPAHTYAHVFQGARNVNVATSVRYASDGATYGTPAVNAASSHSTAKRPPRRHTWGPGTAKGYPMSPLPFWPYGTFAPMGAP